MPERTFAKRMARRACRRKRHVIQFLLWIHQRKKEKERTGFQRSLELRAFDYTSPESRVPSVPVSPSPRLPVSPSPSRLSSPPFAPLAPNPDNPHNRSHANGAVNERTRIHAIRRGHGRCRTGGPGVCNPLEAAQARHQCLCDRKILDRWRSDPFRSGNRTSGVERIAARMGRQSTADLRACGQGRILVSARCDARDENTDTAANAQSRQLHRLTGRAVRVARTAGRSAGRGNLPRFCRQRTVVQRRR